MPLGSGQTSPPFLPNELVDWIQVGEAATGTPDPLLPLGSFNRHAGQLLANDVFLRGRVNGAIDTLALRERSFITVSANAAPIAAYDMHVICINSGAINIQLPGTSGLPYVCRYWIKKYGVGKVTILPPAGKTIDGKTSIVLQNPGEMALVGNIASNSDWFTWGRANQYDANLVEATGDLSLPKQYENICIYTSNSPGSITLPSTVSAEPMRVLVKNRGTSAVTILSPDVGKTIDGEASFLLPFINTAVRLYSTADGNWIVGDAYGLGVVEPGTQVDFCGAGTLPFGYLLCDGSAVSRTTYARLFEKIGTTWGSGNGSTTFNVPDSRGKTVIGAGTGSGLTARSVGQSGGAETHHLTVAQMPSHGHGGIFPVPIVGANGGAGGHDQMAAWFGQTTLTTGGAGGGQVHNNMQPFNVAKKMIKY